mmetsp:Transcript_15396/g.31954  ORF Transcript_15396/g.31954 Transcript_15396/m.31954 type:complete len:82 (+) Transcript_15396:220-465(+)
MVFRSKPLRVGVPMVGVVLFGYWSLTSVLKGRIQDHDAQHLNDSPKIPESNKNKGKLDMQKEIERARDDVKDTYELKSTRR